ncbi:unnamed protein product [[Actinomadura] parvosata subsp. kistnae]|uniref:DUF4185 domain-containing protein n=1 Tax=[Actinomadura] parvosata subsp. kistnae TaxID=1909395 RepID=A0A1V0ACT9_9ACTN|nr:DUF4185 domain-containing protein [Nonomuraea sp. ATCC 55076]AQZ68003.1 DUF4185 domain-containing protein [Nonomuraea sp. ATCC 55076]SPL93627.1 unnamed protein product [Actinomadura parvosata subsp. kistnae]
MTRFRTALAPLAITLIGLAAQPVQAAPPKPVPVVQERQVASAASACAPTVRSASTNARLTSLFTTYGNDNSRLDDWTGADGTYSLKLPGGKELWVFSDTFLGRVNPDGSRPPVVEEGGTTVFLNNSFAVERDGRLATIHDGTPAKPAAVMPPRDDKHWFWAGDATLAGGVVEVTYQEYERFGTGAWDWRWHRNVVARFAPGRLNRPISVHDLPSGHGVAWASGILKDGGYTYVYGVEDLGSPKYMHVARVKGQSLLGQWEFLKADGTWSASEADSARIMSGVANEYSVSRVGDGYVLITHDTTEALSPNIVAYSACSPAGPFTGKQHVYTTPETSGNVFTYNAHAHPEVDGPGLVVSYNVNSFVNTDHYRDVTIYRPRFLDVTFG